MKNLGGPISLLLVALGVAFSTPAFAEKQKSAPTPPKLILFSKMIASIETEPNQLRFGTTFTLGKESKGIDPLNEIVAIRVDKLLFTVPAGSFHKTELGWFKFEGKIDGNDAEIEIVPLPKNTYVLRGEISGRNFKAPDAGPAKVQVSVANDAGVTMTRAWNIWY